MYSQPETILEQYELTVNGITKGRGIYICDTSLGMKALTAFRGSAERAWLLDKVLTYLQEQKIVVEQLCRTKEGEILAKDDAGGKYLLKDLFSGSECNPKSVEDMVCAVQALAKLHRCLRFCPVAIPDFTDSDKNSLRLLYEKHYHELIKVKNFVKSRKKKNEFEMKFQKNYPHFMGQAERSLAMLTACEAGWQRRCLCHGDFNQHNVICTQSGWQIINFENINANLPMADFCNFLRKMMEKNNWDFVLGQRLLDAYDRTDPLGLNEYRQLYVLLLFPEKFWKLSNHYFNSHKAWLSERDIEKLDRMMEQEQARELFLENLFSIIR